MLENGAKIQLTAGNVRNIVVLQCSSVGAKIECFSFNHHLLCASLASSLRLVHRRKHHYAGQELFLCLL